MKKKLISILLSVVMLCALAVPAMAVDLEAAQGSASELYKLELFQGVGADENGEPDFDLERAPNRHEAVTMLVRLLGKEAEAKAGTWDIPFTDVADWAKPYVGYAYANGLTNGVSATRFGGETLVSASQYLTFLLRALGYTSGEDFQWDRAWELSDEIGLTGGEYNAETTEFLRGDVAVISLNALFHGLKDTETSLASTLRVPAVNYEYTLNPDAEHVVANKVFDKDVTVTGSGYIAFVNCVFQGDVINAGGEGAIVDISTLSEANGLCYIKNDQKEATLDTPLPKFYASVPINVVVEDCMGAVISFSSEVTFNGEKYTINEEGVASDNVTQFIEYDPDADEITLVDYKGQTVQYVCIAQWWENGEKVEIASAE